MYERLTEEIERNLRIAATCRDLQAQRSQIQRARGVWNFGRYLIRSAELILTAEQETAYDALDKTIFDADHALDGK